MTADPHIEQALHNLRMAARVSPVLKGWLDIVEESHHALAARLEAAERDLADARKAMEFLANETLFGSIVAEYAQKKLAAAQQPPAEEPDG